MRKSLGHCYAQAFRELSPTDEAFKARYAPSSSGWPAGCQASCWRGCALLGRTQIKRLKNKMLRTIATTDLAYVCLHEAGHAAATYHVGGSVEFIELIYAEGKTEGMTRAHRPPEGARTIAAAGFAAECVLFRANRLTTEDGTPLSQKAFIDGSMNNASKDKVSFFGKNYIQPDGTWPEHMDVEFMNFAIGQVQPLLRATFPRLEDLAAALGSTGRVEQEQIERILGVGKDDA
jgi:hypothetical protein